jgi:hypothetical protein
MVWPGRYRRKSRKIRADSELLAKVRDAFDLPATIIGAADQRHSGLQVHGLCEIPAANPEAPLTFAGPCTVTQREAEKCGFPMPGGISGLDRNLAQELVQEEMDRARRFRH